MYSQPHYRRGDTIGNRFLVFEVLTGGIGEIYLGFDSEFNSIFALKTLQQYHQANVRIQKLFEEEVGVWIGLEIHPNIVSCYFLTTLDNQPFMFLEWVVGEEGRGSDLRSWLKHGSLDMKVTLDITIDICRGLIHAGKKQPGIVHCDLKPENILIGQGCQAKITDFGLAKVAQRAKSINASGPMSDHHMHLEHVDTILGTPEYMPPEQWRGEALDARADIYAMGCVVYEMLTGRLPFNVAATQRTQQERLNVWRTQHIDIPPLTLPAIFPSRLSSIVRTCLAKQREDRFSSVDELLGELIRFYQEEFHKPPRPALVGKAYTAAALSNRGATYQALQRYDEAMRDYDQAIQFDPSLLIARQKTDIDLLAQSKP